MSYYKKYFTENNQGDKKLPLKLKDISRFEELKYLKKKFFDLSSNEENFSPKYYNKNYDDEQIDLLFFETQYIFF